MASDKDKEIAELKLQKALLEDELTKKNLELADALAVNELLQKEIESLSSAAPDKPKLEDGLANSFDLDGVSYPFNFHKMQYGGKTITSGDVASDEVLQRELISMGSGMISFPQ